MTGGQELPWILALWIFVNLEAALAAYVIMALRFYVFQRGTRYQLTYSNCEFLDSAKHGTCCRSCKAASIVYHYKKIADRKCSFSNTR